MISYRKLWSYLDENGISQNQLFEKYNFSRQIMHRLRKNEIVMTSTIAELCDILGCQPSDIMENLPADEVTPKAPSARKGGRKKKVEKN